MRRLRYLSWAIVTATAAVAFVAGSGPAYAQTPSAGDACPALHATTQDDDGQTMWCNPTMTGSHSLVWQYGGPA